MKIVHALFAATLYAAAPLAAILYTSAPVYAAATVGQPAPDFTLNDTAGKPHALSSFKGKFVVLEWTNPECPFVQKHYDSSNMQSLQKAWGGKDVVWLTINSTHPRHGDYKKPEQMASLWKQKNAAPQAILMDPDGKVGRMYQARTTPHMYIVNPQGGLVYAGGIDDKRSANPADVKTAKNYVTAALTDALAGKPVATATSSPYGCSVKY